MMSTEQAARKAYWEATAFARAHYANAPRAVYRQMIAQAKAAYLAATAKASG